MEAIDASVLTRKSILLSTPHRNENYYSCQEEGRNALYWSTFWYQFSTSVNQLLILLDYNYSFDISSSWKIKRQIRTKIEIDADLSYGWKHGFLSAQDQVASTYFLLIITREVFSWIVLMFHEPYIFFFKERMETLMYFERTILRLL